jgi:peptide deformylase
MDDDPLLRTVSEPVTDFAEATVLIRTMKEALRERGGRGLAAVQIGVPLRVIIVREPDFTFRPMINPTLDRTLNRFAVEREGCLSIPPSKWGDVSRPAKCDATWFDLDGTKHSATLTGEIARIFQHEFDHLNGVLMTDRRLAA